MTDTITREITIKHRAGHQTTVTLQQPTGFNHVDIIGYQHAIRVDPISDAGVNVVYFRDETALRALDRGEEIPGDLINSYNACGPTGERLLWNTTNHPRAIDYVATIAEYLVGRNAFLLDVLRVSRAREADAFSSPIEPELLAEYRAEARSPRKRG